MSLAQGAIASVSHGINENDEPVHVHMRKADGSAKFWVQPVELVWADGLKGSEVREAQRLVLKHQARIIHKWNEHFNS